MTDTASPLQRVANVRADLADAKRRVADVLLANPAHVAKASIGWVAAEASTTPATVSRLAADLGYSGFAELRSAIATDNGRVAQLSWEDDIGLEFSPDDDAEQVVRVLARQQFMALRNTIGALDLDTLSNVADRLATAPHVHVFGRGGDEVLASELRIRLLRIGVPAWLHVNSAVLDISDHLLTSEDIVIVFSRSGEGTDALRLIQKANARHSLTVAITGNTSTPLSRASQVVLYGGTRHGVYWTEYYAGRASDGLVASALWVLAAQRLARSAHLGPNDTWLSPP